MAAQKFSWIRIGAESIAIVGSILLAFGIDAWYESAQNEELAAQYKLRLAAELRQLSEQAELVDRAVSRAIERGNAASDFFYGTVYPERLSQIVVDLSIMGQDNIPLFAIVTYEDLIATGRLALLVDVDQRESVQRAYQSIQRLESELAPAREEFQRDVRGWIPADVSQRIRGCLSRQEPVLACSELDERTVRTIIQDISTDEARLAYQLRMQGLGATREFARRAKETIDEAIESLGLL